jgi:hypothetical protein
LTVRCQIPRISPEGENIIRLKILFMSTLAPDCIYKLFIYNKNTPSKLHVSPTYRQIIGHINIADTVNISLLGVLSDQAMLDVRLAPGHSTYIHPIELLPAFSPKMSQLLPTQVEVFGPSNDGSLS